jgi:tRNA threonylcarbamoyladenosine biosynthesis protein TsaB
MNNTILLFDTATEAMSVALTSHLSQAEFEVCPQQHSQKLLPAISAQLDAANLKLNQLDALAFGRGPGSFTGVRVGVSVAQGLAFGANLPVIAISNLQIMAQEVFETTDYKTAYVAIDARMGEVYFAEFVKNAEGIAELVGQEQVVTPEELSLTNENALAVGTGFETYHSLFPALTISQTITLPNAKYMAQIALSKLANGDVTDALNAEPVYVRDTVTWKKLPGRE